MPRSPQWMDLYQIWFRGSPRGRNQMCGILWQSAHGFRFCEGSKFAISRWLGWSPLTQCWRYRAACDDFSLLTNSVSHCVYRSHICTVQSTSVCECEPLVAGCPSAFIDFLNSYGHCLRIKFHWKSVRNLLRRHSIARLYTEWFCFTWCLTVCIEVTFAQFNNGSLASNTHGGLRNRRWGFVRRDNNYFTVCCTFLWKNRFLRVCV